MPFVNTLEGAPHFLSRALPSPDFWEAGVGDALPKPLN